MAVTQNLQVTKIDSAQAQKEVTANEAFDAFDAGFSQFTKAMTDADYTLLSTTVPKEWQYGILSFTGALTANRNIIVPTAKKTYVLVNGTTGGFSLTLKTAAGTGVAVSGSTPRILRCDGTNVVDLFTVPNLSTITPNAQTGTTYTYVNADNSKLVTHSNAAAIAGTLPQAGSGGNFTNGWFMFVQNRGAGTLTITPTTSTIDGAASLALTTGQGVLICSDGTNYFTSRGIGGAGGASPAEVLISEVTPSGTGVVTFSSLGSYRSLRITGMGRGTQAATSVELRITFNGDTGSNYKFQRVYGNAGTATADNSASHAYIQMDLSAASAPTSVASSFDCHIPNYANTSFFKTFLGSSNLRRSNIATGFFVITTGAWWDSTAAITSITLTLSAGNYEAGTRISLYGVN